MESAHLHTGTQLKSDSTQSNVFLVLSVIVIRLRLFHQLCDVLPPSRVGELAVPAAGVYIHSRFSQRI